VIETGRTRTTSRARRRQVALVRRRRAPTALNVLAANDGVEIGATHVAVFVELARTVVRNRACARGGHGALLRRRAPAALRVRIGAAKHCALSAVLIELARAAAHRRVRTRRVADQEAFCGAWAPTAIFVAQRATTAVVIEFRTRWARH